MEKEETQKLLNNYPHLKKYLESITQKMDVPVFYSKVPLDLKDEKYPNLIYPTKGIAFIHIYRTKDMNQIEYHAIEPVLNEVEKKKCDKIKELIYEKALQRKDVETDDQMREAIEKFIDEIIVVDEKAPDIDSENKGFLRKTKDNQLLVTPAEKNNIKYAIIKDIVGGGPLECFMGDPYLEDIHIITGEKIHLVHKVFDMIKTNIEISNVEASIFARKLSEKIGSPVSDGQPIADGTLPDGSRVNIIHSKDVSLKGPTMTIRRFTETPISVTQLIKWGTMNSGIAAYLWLCLQYERSVFLCGESACGKTATMNAIIPFISPEKKIYTAENTPELQIPHPVWQRLLTKTIGPKDGQVDLFSLLKAALRSRPDYIIPGEIRGAEGNIVFQAMQTGHPCITTFHASSVTKVIQRFTGRPISVPKTFMDNLDVVLIQATAERGETKIRRCVVIEEIEGYNREADAIMSRTAYEWNPVDDLHIFKANKNSYILEQKIAKNAGYTDAAEIYGDYEFRKHILERMVEENIMDYYEVVQFIWTFYREGAKGLPISI